MGTFLTFSNVHVGSSESAVIGSACPVYQQLRRQDEKPECVEAMEAQVVFPMRKKQR
jgi:hypothetical protein